MRHTTRSIVRLIVLACLLLAFQNCTGCDGGSGVKFNTASDSSGNGRPYDGKPAPGTYYRWVPGFSCAGHPAVQSKLEVTTSTLTLRTVNGDCSESVVPLNFADVAYSDRALDLIGHLEGIYRKSDLPPDTTNTPGRQLPLTWCRTPQTAASQFDVNILENVDSGSLSAAIQSSGQNPAPTNVTRDLLGKGLRYTAFGFDLQINLAQVSTQKTYTGAISIAGAQANHWGGTIQSILYWPAKIN